MLEIQSKAYRDNFGKDFICIIPTNIYGENDNYDLINAHVIPALIHKCYLSKKNNEPFIVKGSGKPLRQFIYSRDIAKLILWIIYSNNSFDNIILSVSEKDEISIKDIALKIAKEFNYEDSIEFDCSFSNGQFKKQQIIVV